MPSRYIKRKRIQDIQIYLALKQPLHGNQGVFSM